MEVKVYHGNEIENIIPDLARLRMTVFHDFPYLYEGDFEYEKNYLKIYLASSESTVVAVFDYGRMVGAASAMPLKAEANYVQAPFLEQQININQIYYFGESVLLKEYRGRGLGNIFFDEREKAALKFQYPMTCFCAVVRSIDHPMKPLNYRPLDEFWMKRGYQKNSKLIAAFSWKDIGDLEETKKSMVYWVKSL
jgi:GNAT superfamily N-acetyltransferase